MSTLAELCAWYASHCDGEWEHSWGVSIETFDNPGWGVTIRLSATTLAGKAFDEIQEGEDDQNYRPDGTQIGPWMICWVENKEFHGRGSPDNLERILRTFLDWAKEARHA